jgi:hypothetical protein
MRHFSIISVEFSPGSTFFGHIPLKNRCTPPALPLNRSLLNGCPPLKQVPAPPAISLLERGIPMKKIVLSMVLASGLALAACSQPADDAAADAAEGAEAAAEGAEAAAEGAMEAAEGAAEATGDAAAAAGEAAKGAMEATGEAAAAAGDAAAAAGEAAEGAMEATK